MKFVKKLSVRYLIPLCFFFFSDSLFAQNSTAEHVDEYVNLGRSHVQSNTDSMVFYFDKAIEKATELNDKERLVYLFREKGYYLEIANRTDYALSKYKQAEEVAAETENADLILDVYTDIAIANRKKGEFENTRNYHTKALELARKEGHLRGLENSFHGLGYLYETTGDYELAIHYYLESLKIAEQRDEKPGMVTTLQNVATTYSKINNHELALETIGEAYELALEIGDSTAITNVLHDQGAVLETSGDLDEALKSFDKSLKINRIIMSQSTVARSLMYIANVYNKKEMFEVSENYLTECLGLKDFMRDEDLAELYNKLGNLYLMKKQTQTAQTYFLNSLKIAEKHNFPKLRQLNNFDLYRTYAQTDQPRALYYLEKSTALKDSIFNAKQARAMAELQFRFNAEKSEKQIHALESQQNKLLLIGSSILFGILFLFMAFLIRIKTKNNRTLKQKNAEIQQQNIQLKESNEVLQQFAWVAAHDLKEPLRSIGSFISLFQRKYGSQFNKEGNEYMNYVRNGVNRMNELLNALLQYSTISIQKPTDEMIDVKDIIREVSENLRETIEEKNAEIHFAEDLPSLRMSELHVTQLFQNLISNSLKFSKETPVIHIEGKPEDEQIIFSIQDNGIGINAEYGDKIYKLFHQLDRKAAGRGIGLTICKNIVDKYNGQIWFESNEENGTRFLVSFPKKLAA